MKIQRSSRFVRWCWSASDFAPLHHTTVCELFWRGFVFTPLTWIARVGALIFVLGLVGLIAWEIATTPVIVWGLGGVVAVIALPIWAIYTKRRVFGEPTHSVVAQVVVERAKAWKQRVCPLVELVP